MSYRFKRALGISLALYVATFVVAIVCGMISGQDMSSMNNVPDSYWYGGMVAAVIITGLFTLWYFKSPTLVPSTKGGFMFGLTAAAVGFILDLVLFSLGNTQAEPGQKVDLMEYYGDFRFWIIIVLVLLTASFVGFKKSPKPSSPTPM